MRKSKVLFIYGDNDGFLWEFNDLYASRLSVRFAARQGAPHRYSCEPHVRLAEWQQQAFRLIDGWLNSDVMLIKKRLQG